MSMIQELGARVRATSDDLPVGLVTVAVERLRLAGELLMWVRQTSANPMGVPQIAGALEHAEQAARAVRVAQDALLAYLTAIGLSHDGAPPPDGAWRTGLAAEGDRQAPPDSAPPPPLGQWWAARVKELAGSDGDATDSPAAEGADLMRRVAAGVKSGDRDRLRQELAGVPPPVGLGLSALAPPVLHRLASDLLRHRPQPDDLPQLRRDAAPRVRELLPGLPPPVLDTLLARLCRVPPAERDGDRDAPPPHPADSAVAAGVLTGVLLALLHREPDSLDPHAPEPVDPAEPHA